MQRAIDNQAVGRRLRTRQSPVAAPSIQRDAAPARTNPRAVDIAIHPDSTVVFRNPASALGGVTVAVAGCTAISDSASLIAGP